MNRRQITLKHVPTQDTAAGAPGEPRFEWRAEAGHPNRVADFSGTGHSPIAAVMDLCRELVAHIDEEGL